MRRGGEAEVRIPLIQRNDSDESNPGCLVSCINLIGSLVICLIRTTRRLICLCLMMLLAYIMYPYVMDLITPYVYESHPIDPRWVNPFGDHTTPGVAIRQAPQQVLVTLGPTETVYVVSWVTFDVPPLSDLPVAVGLHYGDNFSLPAPLSIHPFTDKQECSAATRRVHTAYLTLPYPLPDLVPYRISSSVNGVVSSRTFAFRPPTTHFPLTVLAFGDLAGASYNRHPDTCIPLLKTLPYDFVMHIGDIAYNLDDDCGRIGDAFMLDIEQVASSTPYMFAPGNHEAEKWEIGSYRHYLHRFIGQAGIAERSGSRTVKYYSFERGGVHFAVLHTDPWVDVYAYDEAEEQLDWLWRDLATVDRTRTPWVVVMGHRALYCTKAADGECNTESASLRNGKTFWQGPQRGIEPLLLSHGVDLYFSGHTHHYERTWPIARGNATQYNYINPKGTVHVQSGIAGGAGFDYYTVPKKPWEAYRDVDDLRRSVSRLVFHNATHLTVEQHALHGGVFDSFTIVQLRHGGPW